MKSMILKILVVLSLSCLLIFIVLNNVDKNHRLRAEIVSTDCSQQPAIESLNLARSKTLLEKTKQVRVLCWVMTTPENHESRAKHVKATWGKRCNILYFVSTSVNDTLPSIAYNATESRSILWGKTKLGFEHAYKHHRNEADWFLKADDDTYVVVENLRYMLHSHNPLEPIWFGCKYQPYVEQGYMSGGAGYVMSRGALDRFVKIGLNDSTSTEICRQDDDGAEDVEMGKCLQHLNVTSGDSRDENGKPRFFALEPNQVVTPGSKDPDFWYWRNQFYPAEDGEDCCSETSVAFHYLTPEQMYVLDFFAYKLRVFGRT